MSTFDGQPCYDCSPLLTQQDSCGSFYSCPDHDAFALEALTSIPYRHLNSFSDRGHMSRRLRPSLPEKLCTVPTSLSFSTSVQLSSRSRLSSSQPILRSYTEEMSLRAGVRRRLKRLQVKNSLFSFRQAATRSRSCASFARRRTGLLRAKLRSPCSVTRYRKLSQDCFPWQPLQPFWRTRVHRPDPSLGPTVWRQHTAQPFHALFPELPASDRSNSSGGIEESSKMTLWNFVWDELYCSRQPRNPGKSRLKLAKTVNKNAKTAPTRSEEPLDSIPHDKIEDLAKIPLRFEKCMLIGFLICLECLLYELTFMPLKALLTGIKFFYHSIARVIRTDSTSSKQLTKAWLWSNNALRQALRVMDEGASTLGTRMPEETAPSLPKKLATQSRSDDTYMGQFMSKLGSFSAQFKSVFQIPDAAKDAVVGSMTPIELCDAVRLVVLVVDVWLFNRFIDFSEVYHFIRSQSLMKLYVLFNMFEIFERLWRSLGRDAIDSLMNAVIKLAWPDAEASATFVSLDANAAEGATMNLWEIPASNVVRTPKKKSDGAGDQLLARRSPCFLRKSPPFPIIGMNAKRARSENIGTSDCSLSASTSMFSDYAEDAPDSPDHPRMQPTLHAKNQNPILTPAFSSSEAFQATTEAEIESQDEPCFFSPQLSTTYVNDFAGIAGDNARSPARFSDVKKSPARIATMSVTRRRQLRLPGQSPRDPQLRDQFQAAGRPLAATLRQASAQRSPSLRVFKAQDQTQIPRASKATSKSPTFGPILKLIFHFMFVQFYAFVHNCTHLIRMLLFNIAMNTFDSAIFLIATTNNFTEIKSTVFKKFNDSSLFTIVSSDAIERFYLFCDFLVVSIEFGSAVKPLTISYMKIIRWLVSMFMLELLIDWFKHAFLLKLNALDSQTFQTYYKVLLADIIICRSPDPPVQQKANSGKLGPGQTNFSHLLQNWSLPCRSYYSFPHTCARRIGFVALPLSAQLISCIPSFFIDIPLPYSVCIFLLLWCTLFVSKARRCRTTNWLHG